MKRTQRWTRGALLAALVAAVPQVATTQVTTGGITGRVSESGGTPVPEATVEGLKVATGFSYVVRVRPTGTYLVQGLERGGPYRVSFRSIGFQPSVREGVTVLLSQNVRLDAVLARQAVELEAVVVQGQGDADFTPARQGAQTTITDSLLRRLPTIDRDFTDFIKLTPQVAVREGEGGIAAVGQNNRFNTIQVDGSTVNDRFGLGRTGQAGGQADGRSVGIEAVKEYQILLSPYDVRQGNFTGALINAVTKGGTNEFKVSAFAYRRQQNWAGFPVDQREFSNTQWGFSFGGPIQRDRLDGTTEREPPLRIRKLALVHRKAGPVLLAAVGERRNLEFVGTAFGHGIDQRAGEVPLAYVIRRKQDLILLHGLDTHAAAVRLPAGLARSAEAEPVVHGGTVHLNGVEAVVLADSRDATFAFPDGHLRRELDEVGEIPVDRRKTPQQRIGDRGLRALPSRREVRVALALDHDRLELHRLPREHRVQPHVLR